MTSQEAKKEIKKLLPRVILTYAADNKFGYQLVNDVIFDPEYIVPKEDISWQLDFSESPGQIDIYYGPPTEDMVITADISAGEYLKLLKGSWKVPVPMGLAKIKMINKIFGIGKLKLTVVNR